MSTTRTTCAFCGVGGKLTGEHVFGDWLARVGLDVAPALYRAGPLARIGRDLGVRPPFRQTVHDVCGSCNSGWMSRLEALAGRVLTPFILGELGAIEPEDQGAIAAWVQKSALVAMLVSSDADRAKGYGLPPSEYREMYALRDKFQPLSASQFWIGRYDGGRVASVHVTPVVVAIEGLPEPDRPQGYTMTIALGGLVLQGVRFTTPNLQVELSTRRAMPQLWPVGDRVNWPAGDTVDDTNFLHLCAGTDLQVMEQHIALRPWKAATDLPDSKAGGGRVELPMICGRHVAYYPAVLVHEALDGRFYAFMTSCECPRAYLIHTEPDGAHCKAADTWEVIGDLYETLAGEEYVIGEADGGFVCKRLTNRSQGVPH